MFLDRSSLLKPEELRIEKVELDGDNFIYVRMWTGSERERFEKSLTEEVVAKDGTITYKQNTEHFRAKLVVSTACDENGVLIFKFSDYAELSRNISARRLMKIAEASQELNKIDETSKEKLIKNSNADQKDEGSSESGLALVVVDTAIQTDGLKQ
jgi:hypothetical protein